MAALSAPDAISPALRRMRVFLFRPFRMGTFLKLSLVAVITEGFGSGFNFSWPGHHRAQHVSTVSSISTSPAWMPGSLNPGWFAALAALGVVLLILGFWLAYLITRLRFAYFYCLIHNTREIRPGWRLYRSQATRFFWMNLVVGLCFVAVIVVLGLTFGVGIWGVLHRSGGHPGLGPMVALILPAIMVFLAIIVVAIGVDVILRDFMLPHYALENATAGQAWAGAWQRFRAEKGGFIAYALLRIFLPLVTWLGLGVILILPGIFFALVIVFVEIGIHAAFAHAAGAMPAVGIALEVLVGVFAAAVATLVAIGVGGPLSTAVREYALVFYGGRYQPLGDALAPPPDAGLTAPA